MRKLRAKTVTDGREKGRKTNMEGNKEKVDLIHAVKMVKVAVVVVN